MSTTWTAWPQWSSTCIRNPHEVPRTFVRSGRNRPMVVLADKQRSGHHRSMAQIRRVVILAFPDCQSLDVVGPAEVFSTAGAYEIDVVPPDPLPFFLSNGMRVVPAAGMDDVRGAIDT